MARSIREEIGQGRPFASVGQEAVVALLRTASLVQRRFEALAREHGITFQQFNVLRILRGAAAPLPTMAVGARMLDPEPGITRLLGRLEQKGLIERTRCSEDGRRMLCAITPAGLHVLAGLDDPVEALDATVLGALSNDQLRRLVDLLDHAREPLHTGAPEIR